MPLAASGEMSIGGSTATRSINLELSRAAGATSSLGETALRNLAGVASGAISISNFYGKSAITVSLASITTNDPYAANGFNEDEPVSCTLEFFSDGTWSANLEANIGVSDNWAVPTTAGVGASYWIRFTRTSFGGGFGNSATPTTGWGQLNTTRGVEVFCGAITTSASAQYTIEIATDSAGSNIIATAAFINLSATVYGA